MQHCHSHPHTVLFFARRCLGTSVDIASAGGTTAGTAAQEGGRSCRYQLRKPFEQLSLSMLVTAATLTPVVLVPPCHFRTPFVRFKG